MRLKREPNAKGRLLFLEKASGRPLLIAGLRRDKVSMNSAMSASTRKGAR